MFQDDIIPSSLSVTTSCTSDWSIPIHCATMDPGSWFSPAAVPEWGWDCTAEREREGWREVETERERGGEIDANANVVLCEETSCSREEEQGEEERKLVWLTNCLQTLTQTSHR